MQGQQELEKRARRDIEEEFARVMGRRVPDEVVGIALRDLVATASLQGSYSSGDVAHAVRYTLARGLDCLQTVLRAAKSF